MVPEGIQSLWLMKCCGGTCNLEKRVVKVFVTLESSLLFLSLPEPYRLKFVGPFVVYSSLDS